MFMKTKLAKLLAAASVCCLSTLALAGGPDMPHHNLYSGGWGAGVEWNNHFGFGLRGSYTTDQMTASLSTNLIRNDRGGNTDFVNKSKHWDWGLLGAAGLRDRAGMTNLFTKYGVGFGLRYISNKSSGEKTPWFVGPFAGLDYQPLRHLMVSGSIYPVSYARDLAGNKYWGFFDEGSLAMSYIF